MGLLAPFALVALPLLGAIVALYLLRMRRPSAPVASLELWDELRRDREANTLWQRLQFSVLLLLQLAVLLALILALGRPWVNERAEGGRNVVLVIDTSASMGATDAGDRRDTTRLEAAKQEALRIIDRLQPGGLGSVISVDSQASIVLSGAEDKARLRTAIRSLNVRAAPADMVGALKLAGALAARNGNTAIWVLSDGRFPPAREQVGRLQAEVNFFPIGRRPSNQAITAFSLDDTEGRQRLFTQVFNGDTITVTRRFEVYVDDTPWEARNLTIGPGATEVLVLDDIPLGGRIVHGAFTLPDDLTGDDQAWAVNRSAVPGNVLLVTGGNKFLESALSLLPNVNLYKVAPVSYDRASTIEGSAPHLTVFDVDATVPPVDDLPEGNLLIFGPSEEGALIQATGIITGAVPVPVASSSAERLGTQETNPAADLLRFVDFGGVHIARSKTLSVPGWAVEVVKSDAGPLIVAGELEGRRVVAVGFDLRDTDLALQPAFPLLARNLVGYLLPPAHGGMPAAVAPGERVTVESTRPDVDLVLIEDPSGAEKFYSVSLDDPLEYSETGTPGIYYVTEYAGDFLIAQEAFAVNYFSREEASIAPVAAPLLPIGQSVTDASTTGAGAMQPREVWPLVALVGFSLLLVEWLYAQRIVIRRALTEMRSRRALRRLERS